MDMAGFPIASPFSDGTLNLAVGTPVIAAIVMDLTNTMGNIIHVVVPGLVSTTTILMPRGATRLLYFEGQTQLVHSATKLVCPGSSTITTTAGDWCEVVNDNGLIRITQYMRATGLPISGDPNVLPLGGGTMNGLLTLKTGTNIASASTVNLSTATGNFVHITGTTTITTFTIANGEQIAVTFDGILTLTYNASTLITPTSGNIITGAGDVAIIVGDGANNARILSYFRASGLPNAPPNFIQVQEQQTSGTNGGATSVGQQQRVLNTSLTNTITGASLASNDIILPQGTFYVKAWTTFCATGSGGTTQANIYNSTDSSVLLVGQPVDSDNLVGTNSTQLLPVSGRITTSAANKHIQLRQYCSAVNGTNGLGRPASSGLVEVYSNVEITQIG